MNRYRVTLTVEVDCNADTLQGAIDHAQAYVDGSGARPDTTKFCDIDPFHVRRLKP